MIDHPHTAGIRSLGQGLTDATPAIPTSRAWEAFYIFSLGGFIGFCVCWALNIV